MKTIPSGLATHYAGDATTLAYGLRVTRTDGQIYAYTSADQDALISAVTYLSSPGLLISDTQSSAGYAVDNLEITTLNDQVVFTTFDIFSGVWSNADYVIFEYNWANTADGINVVDAGTVGEITFREDIVIAELRSMQQPLQQTVGIQSAKTCRARLGDDKCLKDLTSFTYTGTITNVTSNQVFRDSARAEAAGWFDDGLITFTSGANAGLQHKIRLHAADGTFTLSLPYWATVSVGHTYSVIAGCKKRLDEDCAAKFANVLNFQGEPHRRVVDDFTQAPIANV